MFDVLMQVPSNTDYDYLESGARFKTVRVEADTEKGAMLAVRLAKFPGMIIKVSVAA